MNTPDGRLEIFAVAASGLTPLASVPVGLEPVAVAARSDGEVWVVNHLSDSISVVGRGRRPRGEVATVALPAAHWRRRGTRTRQRGFRYVDARYRAGPITRVTVSRRGTVTVAGGGPGWAYTLDEPSQGAVAVRLQLGRGDVWCSLFTAKPDPTHGNDRTGRFVGVASRPLPERCPAIR